MGIWKDTLDEELNSIGINKSGRSLKKASHQTGSTIKSIDKKRKAMPSGLRISKSRKKYYEYRKNRSDLEGGI